MKILDSLWFTPAGSMHIIGIVKTENEVGEIKYYIGTSIGLNKKGDEEYIAMYGAKFPKIVGDTLMK
jgi:hypothetical protein